MLGTAYCTLLCGIRDVVWKNERGMVRIRAVTNLSEIAPSTDPISRLEVSVGRISFTMESRVIDLDIHVIIYTGYLLPEASLNVPQQWQGLQHSRC